MQRLATGLLLGGLVGLAVGFALGRGTGAATSSTAVEDVEPETTAAPETSRGTRSRTGARGRREHNPTVETRGVQGLPTPGGFVPPLPPDAPTATSTTAPSAADYLAALRRAANGDRSVNVHALLPELQKHHPRTHVPLELTLALLRAGHGFNAWPAVEAFTLQELRTVLRSAGTARPEDRASWALVQEAVKALARHPAPVEPATARALLEHEMAFVRVAGLRRVHASPDTAAALVREIAARDENTNARVIALGLLVAWDREASGTPSAEVAALVEEALRDAPLDTRRRAAPLLAELGPAGARLALGFLVDDGYAGDEDMLEPLVQAVIAGGLGGELFARLSTPDVYRAAVSVLAEIPDDQLDVLNALAPHFPQIMRNLHTEERYDFLQQLAASGHHGFVATQARDMALSPSRRDTAFAALGDAADDNDAAMGTFVEVAQHMIRDGSQPLETRIHALKSLVEAEPDPVRAFEARKRFATDHSLPAGLRKHALEDLTDDWEHAELLRRLPEIRAVWRGVAANDPSPLVRATAEAMLTEEWQ